MSVVFDLIFSVNSCRQKTKAIKHKALAKKINVCV